MKQKQKATTNTTIKHIKIIIFLLGLLSNGALATTTTTFNSNGKFIHKIFKSNAFSLSFKISLK